MRDAKGLLSGKYIFALLSVGFDCGIAAEGRMMTSAQANPLANSCSPFQVKIACLDGGGSSCYSIQQITEKL